MGLLCVAELAAWAPSYLTWPWWADHDVFATSARTWESGLAPYRELKENNFPGTIYLFWALGKLFGWGYTPAFWAGDVALVLALGAAMVAWSRARFGEALPALVGYATFLGFYLSLDYSQAGQRDWQGPCFAVLGLLAAQAWPGRLGRGASALALATGLAIRPQVALFVPALALAVGQMARWQGWTIRASLRAVAVWWLVVVAGLALWCMPLVWAGIWGDFLRSLDVVRRGGGYGGLTAEQFGRTLAGQLLHVKVFLTTAAVALLSTRADSALRGTARAWLLALVGAVLYRPLSPNPAHAYLVQPLMVMWAIHVSVLTALVLAIIPPPAVLRLATVLLVLGLGAATRPRFCNPTASWRAIGLLRRGDEPHEVPTGYVHNPDVPHSARYDWDDYRRVLDYLRRETSPTTRVANVLRSMPALAGPSGRLPALPAESIAWLRVVRPADEPLFAEALERAPEVTVVVWDPGATGGPPAIPLPRLESTIRRLYEPSARFGVIEVWRAKARPADPPQRPGPRPRRGP
jgi:hypothetical protein